MKKISNKIKDLICIIVAFGGFARVYAWLRVHHAASVTHSASKVKPEIGKYIWREK